MSLTVDYSQKRESMAMKRYSIRTAYRGKKIKKMKRVSVIFGKISTSLTKFNWSPMEKN